MVTFGELRNARFDGWREHAADWKRTADQLAAMETAFKSQVNDATEAAGWKGAAANAADPKLEAALQRITVTTLQARSIAAAMDRALVELPAVQTMLLQAIADAEGAGVRVGDSGGGYVLSFTPGPTGPPPTPDDTARMEQLLAECGRNIDAVLVRAVEADSKYAGALATLTPGDGKPLGADSFANAVEDARRVAALDGVGPLPKMDPKQAADWWRGLTDAQRHQYVTLYANEIGGTDGIPAEVRDVANQGALNTRLHELGALTSLDKAERRELENLTKISETMATNTQRPDGQKLMLLKFGDKYLDGQVVMSIGNPDKAKNTAVYVPGTGSTATDAKSMIDRVGNLQQAAIGLRPDPDQVSSIVWLDYDAPEDAKVKWNWWKGFAASELGSITSSDRSEAGAPRLDSFVNGLRAQSPDNHLTVIAHSYGTAVVGDAARSGDGLAVDDIVAVGSPGMHVDSADDLQLDPGHVWALQASGDSIPGFGQVGHGGWSGDNGLTTPGESAFGANILEAGDGGHSDYWVTDSEPLRNQARVVVGSYDDSNPANRPLDADGRRVGR